MNKIYIFGDSFCERHSYNKLAWPAKLSRKFFVVNESFGGASNHEIFLTFLKYCDIMEDGSVVVLAWTDTNRFYVNPGVEKTQKIVKQYWMNFHNSILTKLYHQVYCSEVKRLAKLKNLKLLILWSFPSDYDVGFSNANWTYSVSDECQHIYFDEFENEIKPSLIHVSKNEIKDIDHTQVADFFNTDPRPNHIESQEIHDALYNIICDFAQNKISGKINLYDRVYNGS